ncbi:DNA methyltransferase [Campylobacter troglodytis]|uniref:DNA methyltransferase n=1 Tax=Campylobacter troglodytis TaxID=654363 RepID=UPI0011584910|nr:DNA methyltransferase [Campylobacter troglodytis]TQR59060.1 DNA methyltransferase [Campylobacter troglodytis]
MKALFADIQKEQEKGRYDKRNTLNDLTGKEWLKLTSSFWFSEKCKLDKDALKHPAPFLVKDIEKLISLFTKKDMTVLDPFCGSGTTLIASFLQGRFGIGYDLSDEFRKLALSRLEQIYAKEGKNFIYEMGNNLDLIKHLKTQSVDYIVTSPPYFNILKNKTQGLRADKSHKGFRNGARSGVVDYEINAKENLENCQSYKDFLNALQTLFAECKRVLKEKKYLSIIISDFTVNKIETNVTGNIIDLMIETGYEFVGNIVLLQPNKPLYPFGYPFAYKINHHNQNILNFRLKNNHS